MVSFEAGFGLLEEVERFIYQHLLAPRIEIQRHLILLSARAQRNFLVLQKPGLARSPLPQVKHANVCPFIKGKEALDSDLVYYPTSLSTRNSSHTSGHCD